MQHDRMIVSEEQAERIGVKRTNGLRGQTFQVFSYEHKRTGLTLFGVRVFEPRHSITTE